MKLSLLCLVSALLACGPHPPSIVVTHPPDRSPDELPPPNPRVATTDEDKRACDRLAALKCPDAPKCLATIADARTDHIFVPSTCLADAADVAAVRRCGDKGTLIFECKRGWIESE